MTDDVLPKPPRLPVTDEFLAESLAKQAAYAAARRRHVAAFRSRDDDGDEDAEAGNATAQPAGKRTQRRIEDKRQLKFEL